MVVRMEFALVVAFAFACDEAARSPEGPGDGGGPPVGSPVDGGGRGAVRISARAVAHCAVDPPASPGLARATPTASRAGVARLDLLRERGDSNPVQVPQAASIVAVDFGPGGVVAEGEVPAGTYRFIRYSLAYGSVTAPATAHAQGMVLPGLIEFDVATAPHTAEGGRPRAPGEMTVRFSAFGQTFTVGANVQLNCPLSDSGGHVETGGGFHRITVPMPGGPLVVAAGGATAERLATFPLAGAVTWIDLAPPMGRVDFARGVLDILPTTTGSETPARLPICDLLLSDRCDTGATPARHEPAWPMPDSATTTCTDGRVVAPCPDAGSPWFGQDGNSAANPARYTVLGDTVRDEVTGLLWQRTPAAESFDWWGARDYCAGLALAGRRDWSLPSRIELASLLDLGRVDPSIDIATFPGAPPNFFWSASPALFSSLAFGIRFDQGFVYDHDPRVSGRVRCVTDTRPSPVRRLVVDGDCVRDEATGLTWQRAVLPAASWRDALAGCRNLRISGATDWRLPTHKELLTIVEDSALSPSTDIAAFAGTPAEWLWASSPGLIPPDYAWTVSFTDGFSTPAVVNQLYVSRCVRGP